MILRHDGIQFIVSVAKSDPHNMHTHTPQQQQHHEPAPAVIHQQYTDQQIECNLLAASHILHSHIHACTSHI